MAEEKDMSYIAMEDLLNKVHSIYQLVVLASRRAVELNDGAEKLIKIDPKVKPSTAALEEIREGKITCKESEGEK
jgi:DNA-directed RNA polymerase omega subunit